MSQQVLQKSTLEQLIDHGCAILSDTYLLMTKTQSCHWNIEGMNFYSLHLLFEQQYQELFEALDEIAEHIRTFGRLAPGSFQQFMQLTQLQEMPAPTDSRSMLEHLYRDHKAIAESLRAGINLAEEEQEAATSDLYTQRLRAHNKMAWMLKSHLNR